MSAPATRPDHAREVRSALTDPVRLCHGLGLSKGSQRQGGGVTVCCPAHQEKSPSCSVTLGEDGTIRVRCFGCGFTGDALSLIAAVRGLSLRSADDFRTVLAEGAQIGGALSLEAEILDGKPRPDRPAIVAPPPRAAVAYPDANELRDLWDRAAPVTDDREASGYLVFRRIDPEIVAARSLARVITASLPPWATCRGQDWVRSGHRLIVRAVDADGHTRSLRAIRVRDGEPKRVAPAGRKATELVLANDAARRMLRGDAPGRVVVVEGEPDWLTWSTRIDEPVIGIVSGSWTERFASAIPRDCRVVIRTHADEAGERYAATIIASLSEKPCTILRAGGT